MEEWIRKIIEFLELENSETVRKILEFLGLENAMPRRQRPVPPRRPTTSRRHSDDIISSWLNTTGYNMQNNATPNTNSNNKTTIEEDLVFDPISGEFKSRSDVESKSSSSTKNNNRSSSTRTTNTSSNTTRANASSNSSAQSSSNQSAGNPTITGVSYDGEINGHGYVDLGLPSGLKWATCNVGASWPGEYGQYFSWGDNKAKPSYLRGNSSTFQMDNTWLRNNGYIGSDGNLTLAHDPARHNWGGTWRMPTRQELEELVRYTTTRWATFGGVKGRFVVSKINGKGIFLPASGWQDGNNQYSQGIRGYCWGSTPNTQNLWRASYICFHSDGFEVDWSDRFLGRSVRPVSN